MSINDKLSALNFANVEALASGEMLRSRSDKFIYTFDDGSLECTKKVTKKTM